MKTIACFGSGEGELGERAYENMMQVGGLLAEKGFRIATGGYGGSGMEAPALGAKQVLGETIGYTFAARSKRPNAYLDEVVCCGQDVVLGNIYPADGEILVPNNAAMQWATRLGFLLQADGFVVDITDKTPGTLIEFLSVVNANVKDLFERPKPIVVLDHEFDPATVRDRTKFVQIAFDVSIKFANWARIETEPTGVVWWMERYFEHVERSKL